MPASKRRDRTGRLLTRQRRQWSLIKSENAAARRTRLSDLEKIMRRAHRRLAALLLDIEEIDSAIRVMRELNGL